MGQRTTPRSLATLSFALLMLGGCERAQNAVTAQGPAAAKGPALARACEAMGETVARARQSAIDADQDGMIVRNQLALSDPEYRAALAKASREAEAAVREGQAEQVFATAVREVELSETGQPYSSNIGQDLVVVFQVCAA